MATTAPLSLAGRTQRWRFSEGPTAGKTYEHTFNTDGTVRWREVEGTSQGKPSAEKPGAEKGPTTRYAAFEVAPGVHLVSYLSESGYTLTVLVNTNDRQLHGFASNAKEWYPLTGSLVSTG
jgi:hypothetical protein